jgi:hypothetical protein
MLRSYDHLQAEISAWRLDVRRKPWTWPSIRNRMQTTKFNLNWTILFCPSFVLSVRFSFFSCCSHSRLTCNWPLATQLRTYQMWKWNKILLVWLEVEEVTLWLTVSQSGCLDSEHPCGNCDQRVLPVGMLLSEICFLVSVGRHLWREDGSVFCRVIT